MKIVVCVKEVPELTEVRLDPATNTLCRAGAASQVNPFDLHALEVALRIKDRAAAAMVTVLSMGLMRVAETLKELIARGADAAVLLSDPAFAGSDTLATSYILAKGIERIGRADLILCGRQAIDGATGQVGPELAERLGIPHLAWVTGINDLNERELVAERACEAGYERVQVTLPALLTVGRELNEPRLPSLQGKRRAQNAPVTVWGAEAIGAAPEKIGLTGSPTWVKSVFTPEYQRRGIIFPGPPEAAAHALVKALTAPKLG
ncbi:MAG: electron transfer flavoprotein subunit beta/FixA family protein [Bacillota bacterium]|jgi:electron transfer flavoprotein beta subunit